MMHSTAGQQSRVEDPQLDEIVFQVSAKFEAGETPELATYQREYPELADRLGKLWTTLQAVADLGRTQSPAADPGTPPIRPMTLGDYEILGEAGRGGMGIVYEAVQISLGRRVALKVLPFAAVWDAKQLQRFKHEAQVAAGLTRSLRRRPSTLIRQVS